MNKKFGGGGLDSLSLTRLTDPPAPATLFIRSGIGRGGNICIRRIVPTEHRFYHLLCLYVFVGIADRWHSSIHHITFASFSMSLDRPRSPRLTYLIVVTGRNRCCILLTVVEYVQRKLRRSLWKAIDFIQIWGWIVSSKLYTVVCIIASVT
jgi:hypothetical protein